MLRRTSILLLFSCLLLFQSCSTIDVRFLGFAETTIGKSKPVAEPLIPGVYRIRTGGMGIIRGEVVNSEGNPVGDANISFSKKTDASTEIWTSFKTDPDGKFTICFLTDGTYSVVAMKEEYFMETSPDIVIDSKSGFKERNIRLTLKE